MCVHEKNSCLWMQKSPVSGKNTLIIGTKPIYGEKTVLIMGQKKVKKVPFMWARISVYGSKYFHLLGKKSY